MPYIELVLIYRNASVESSSSTFVLDAHDTILFSISIKYALALTLKNIPLTSIILEDIVKYPSLEAACPDFLR